jgi:hypothetical protein
VPLLKAVEISLVELKSVPIPIFTVAWVTTTVPGAEFPMVNPACELTTESVPMFSQLSTKIGANGEPFWVRVPEFQFTVPPESCTAESESVRPDALKLIVPPLLVPRLSVEILWLAFSVTA